jgi:Sec-independent protein translocase protein TatA
MLHILGIFFLLFIVVLFIGVNLVASFFRALFGGTGGRRNASGRESRGFYNETRSEEETTQRTTRKRRKKIFSKDEGEYVDFEEIDE